MNALDYAVLLTTILGIAAYGVWQTRHKRDLATYLHGDRNTSWFVIGISVMATQASAVTFLSTPGQGYADGLKFVQNYFGAPFALIIISAVFLPIFRKLNVHTAYEYIGKRFDGRTRLLAAALFLLQRGMSAGITIYAPAIVLSTVFGWPLSATIIVSGLIVTIYTVSGGCDAVNLTQKYQFAVILAGMIAALYTLLHKLPAGLTLPDAMHVAGGFHKLNAVDFSFNPHERYTFWSGLFGGMFLALSYFGTDQSQVQRYLSGGSLRESRLGLMFNAIFKIPMQFLILLLGALLFVFYQFERPPLMFSEEASHFLNEHGGTAQFNDLNKRFIAAHDAEHQELQSWLAASHAGADPAAVQQAFAAAAAAQQKVQDIRAEAQKALSDANFKAKSNEADYVFITFILRHLSHGLIGLLIAVFFAATLSSKAGELSALGSCTVIDFYSHIVHKDGEDAHYVLATKVFTALWGLIAIGFALSVNLAENLIQAQNILASLLYGVVLGLFCVAFFVRWVRGAAVFWAALIAQTLIVVLFFELRNTRWEISYLWFNVIGCAACVGLAMLLQATQGGLRQDPPPPKHLSA